jgi:hypothetical protein
MFAHDTDGWDVYAPHEWEALAGHLDDVRALLTRHVAFPTTEAADATSAWIVHAHLVRLGAFDSTPRLAALSPEKGSGKTRLLEVIELLTPSPLHAVNVSAAAMFRLVEKSQPTLLLDECDTYLGPRVSKEHEDVRGLVNAGHRRGAVAVRCVGEGAKLGVREFPAFCGVAFAGIGDLPDTIMQRSIVIAMKRRRPDEVIEPFRARTVEPIGHAIRDRIAAWCTEHWNVLDSDLKVEMPDGVTDRPADVWEPLVTIGDAASCGWSERIRNACVAMSGENVARDASLGVRLLGDIQAVFDAERISTEALLIALNKLEESPWGNLRGHALDARQLAKLLKNYGIRSSTQRIGEHVAKGYARADFHDAWMRYVPSTQNSVTSVTSDTAVTLVTDVTQSQQREAERERVRQRAAEAME